MVSFGGALEGGSRKVFTESEDRTGGQGEGWPLGHDREGRDGQRPGGASPSSVPGLFPRAQGPARVGLAEVSLEGALEKDELNSACYLLRRVLALASASWSLCLLFPSHAPILRRHQKGKTNFHLRKLLFAY